jgi:hypothetical protein
LCLPNSLHMGVAKAPVGNAYQASHPL